MDLVGTNRAVHHWQNNEFQPLQRPNSYIHLYVERCTTFLHGHWSISSDTHFLPLPRSFYMRNITLLKAAGFIADIGFDFWVNIGKLAFCRRKKEAKSENFYRTATKVILIVISCMYYPLNILLS